MVDRGMPVTTNRSDTSIPAPVPARRGRMPLWGLAVFLSIVLFIDGSVHAYLAQRLILAAALPALLQALLLAGTAVMALLMIGGPMSERLAPRAVARWLAPPGFAWIGIMWLLLVLTVLSDLLLAGGCLAGVLPIAGDETGIGAARVRSVCVVSAAGFAALVGAASALSPPAVRRIEVVLDRWPAALDGFRLVQLSDLHLGAILGERFSRQVTDRTCELQPDLIAITGDLADGPVAHYLPAVRPMAELRARHGVFFVTGNHEYISDAESWIAAARDLGWTVLRNEHRPLDGFDVAGVEDHQAAMFGAHGEDLDRALAGRDPDRPLLLLAHQPRIFTRAAAAGVDLQLAGHTHGGQIFPFATLIRGVYTKYVAGLFREGRSWLYVSRGTGFWGPPMRLAAPAEITLIEIRSGAGP